MLHLHYRSFHVAGYWKCSNTKSYIHIHWFCRSHTSIQNTWQQTSYFNVDFDNNGLFLSIVYFRHINSIQGKCISIWAINFIIKSIKKGFEVLAKSFFSFSIIVFNMKCLVVPFIRKIICQGTLFGSLYTSNRIYFLRNCFSNYVYLKDMYMHLKGTGKILLVEVLRNLLISKTLTFTTAFTKIIKVSKVCIQFSV